jgi:transcriptional regulator NrdR family protein
MKCPKCSAESIVLETRVYLDAFSRRGRVCSGPERHRFSTYEVYAGNLDKRTLDAKRRGFKARHAAAARRRAVLSRPDLSASELARHLNITEARVRQLRATGHAA